MSYRLAERPNLQNSVNLAILLTSILRTGRVLDALGNVRASKAMHLEARDDHEAASKFWNESFAIHVDCLKRCESTLGIFGHRTANAYHKLTKHHTRHKEHTLTQ